MELILISSYKLTFYKFLNFFIKRFKQYHIFFKQINFPVKQTRFCLLRSPHGDKDSREHIAWNFYKTKFYMQLLKFSWLDHILQKKIPNSIDIQIKIL